MARQLKKTEDAAEAASRVLSRVIDLSGDSDTEPQTGKDPRAVALGSKGGKAGGQKGGTARAKALSPERRSEIARKAAKARWAKRIP